MKKLRFPPSIPFGNETRKDSKNQTLKTKNNQTSKQEKA